MALVIAVAESSLQRDRMHKARINAAAAVSVHWIDNLIDRQIEVYSGPVPPPVYCNRRDKKARERVPLILDNKDLGPIDSQELLSCFSH